MKDFSSYSYRPFIIDAKKAHERGVITYQEDGTVLLQITDQKLTIPLGHQYSLIRPTFDDLSKALSSTANSPIVTGEKSLRQQFDEEFEHYEQLVEKAEQAGKWEPDYGTYVYDQMTHDLFLLAPEFWHRLGLVTNNSKLMTDPHKKLSWQQIRNIFDKAVIGFVGASVGGNILEGAMREIRPKRIKIADYDWIEITNLNRLERGSFRYLAASKASRTDPKSSYDLTRINKAEIAAYQQHMIDPYAQVFVYNEGLHTDTVEQFLLGNEKDEPKIDVLVEECDDLRVKIELRKLCRKHSIPLLMMSDWGHMVEGQFLDFKKNQNTSFGYNVSDDDIHKKLDIAMSSGKREDRFDFVKALCGDEIISDEFGLWINGNGEQPTSSLPQSGSTAMSSGGIGGKVLALHLLGYTIPERFIYDLRNFTVLF